MVLHGEKTLKTTILKNLSKLRNLQEKYLRLSQTLFLQFSWIFSGRTTAVELFCGNDQRVKAVSYFRKKAPSWMFDRILNATLPITYCNSKVSRNFPPPGLSKGILNPHPTPFLLIFLGNQQAKSNKQRAKSNEQRAKINEQRAKSNEQRAKSNEQRATSKKFSLQIYKQTSSSFHTSNDVSRRKNY